MTKNQLMCSICNDDGKCLNNKNNPNYDDGFFGSDIYDCQEYLEEKEGKPKGSWMVEWGKRLNKNNTEKSKPSGFKEWSNKVIDDYQLQQEVTNKDTIKHHK